MLTAAISASVLAYFGPLADWNAQNPLLPGQRWMRSNLFVGVVLFVVVSVLLALITARGKSADTAEQGDPELVERSFSNRDRSLTDLRKRVRGIWVNQVLANSLEKRVPLRLGFATAPGALNGEVEVREKESRVLSVSSLEFVFDRDEAERRLLIVGRPGAGKTTQLLHLLEALLDAADADESAPVPVLLPLSEANWARIGTSVHSVLDWLGSEILKRYRVLDEQWLTANNSPLVLLLDGLDEIPDSGARDTCVQMLSRLNRYTFGMVVASRKAEYFQLRSRLHFDLAVEILPLTSGQIGRCLADAGPEAEGLRAACLKDRTLLKLFQDPLALVVAILAYRGRTPGPELLKGSASQRLDQLWEQYVTQMLDRRRFAKLERFGDRRFPPARTELWLRLMARVMSAHGRVEFDKRDLGPEWLPNSQVMGMVTVMATAWSLLVVAGGVMLLRHLDAGIAGTTVTAVSILLCLVAGWSGIGRRRTVRFPIWYTLLPTIYLFIAGLFVGFGVGVFYGQPGLAAGLIPLNLFGPVGILIALVLGRYSDPARDADAFRPNTGLDDVLKDAGAIIVLAVIPWVSLVVAHGPLASSHVAQQVLAISIGPGVIALWASASSILVSMAGRRVAVMWGYLSGQFPRPLGAFLAHVDERILMSPSSSGYQFLHVTLLDHLAGAAAGVRQPEDDDPGWLPASGPTVLDQVATLAAQEATTSGVKPAGTEHLLLGAFRQAGRSDPDVWALLGITGERLRRELDSLPGSETPALPVSPMTEQAERSLHRAEMEAAARGDRQVGVEHLVLSLLADRECHAAHLLRRLGVSSDRLVNALTYVRSGVSAYGLRGALLISAPDMSHRRDATSVIMVFRHRPDGAYGVVLNAPTSMLTGDGLPGSQDLAVDPKRIFSGGDQSPDRWICLGWLRADRDHPPWSYHVTGNVYTLEVGAEQFETVGEWFTKIRIFAGHVAWPSGQLERDLFSGATWLVGVARNEPFSRMPDDLYAKLARRSNVAYAWLDISARVGNPHAVAALRRLSSPESLVTGEE
ncbi:YqgE/AlgH family protein [Actinoplanes sp. NPDC048796]|uniref:YqgE/AlgH family protein n=1 Tax=unclassified Actinoplanes TaxID=2626549 RepID=UPI0033C268B1